MRNVSRSSRAYLVMGLALAVVQVLLGPNTYPSHIMFLTVAASGPVAIVVAMRRRRLPHAWALLLAGCVLMVSGDALWISYEIAGVDPFPSLADALYLPGYPLIAVGLLAMLRARRAGSERDGLIDAIIIATGTGVLSWVFLMAPYVRDTDLAIADRAVSAAYPLMSVLLVAVVARLGFARRTARASDVLLAAGLTGLLIADTLLGVIELTVGYEWNLFAEFLWLAMYVLLGAAALTADPTAVDDADDAVPATSRARLRLLMLASLMAPGVLVWFSVRDRDVDLFVIAIGSALLFVLVVVRIIQLVHTIEAQAAEVALLASADPLTGLANRRHWGDEIQRLLAAAARSGRPLCVAMIDLDNFKHYNDGHGHYAGDALLRASAEGWRDQLRATDVLARLGGDEFALALPGCSLERAVEIMERLRRTTPDGHRFSCGLAAWRGESQEQLMIRADTALYAAKEAGRDRTVIADEPMGAPRR